MTLLSVTDLSAGYGTGQVLFDVSLDVDAGEVVGLLGRNGAGKTTTLRAIMGLAEPDVLSGGVTFDGTDITGTRSFRIADRGISFVPEERRCFPELTIEENVRVAAESVPSPLDVEEVLAFFPEIEEKRTLRTRHLSGGQQQMVAIARSLVANPDLMLLDEPCEGLAPLIVRRVEEIIQQINEERGITVLIVEQNVAAAMAVADRHYILNEGRIAEEVSTGQLRENEELRQTYLGV